ncbi:hypothetical protein [Saccharibacillus endophyticus]|uniref:Uncharacterized protein n=1 Tax=Saccharibacillus endophyticus TaxID=2060666 RepID=A0ABQ1ZX20_9BACL|nr:hypothetical protein [Saccharibacillus endophyticus]GGH81512.1 hypothetical protein GCM10007362_31420 [Saccharibacillus endophyticus]
MLNDLYYTSKTISVYVDKKENLIIVPTGIWVPRGAVIDIDSIFELKFPYKKEELEEGLKKGFGSCYSQKVEAEFPEQSAIEKYLKVKSYNQAVKGRKLVSCRWTPEDGYEITPTRKIPRRGFVHQKHLACIIPPHEQEPLQLAHAFLIASEQSS